MTMLLLTGRVVPAANLTTNGHRPDRQGARRDHGMKFVLEVDMGDNAFDGNGVAELGRILRYWAGNLRHYDLKPGDGCEISDSEYREVGRWSIVE
jgi:hypothetical protein